MKEYSAVFEVLGVGKQSLPVKKGTKRSLAPTGVPEWKMDSFADLQNGEAELYEVFSDGTEILRARFDKQLGQFVPIQ